MSRRPRILIVRRRYLGDTVLMHPFVRNLRAHWPEAWISMVVDTPYTEVLADVEELDEIVDMPVGRLGFATHLRGWGRVLRAVAATPWDMAFDFQRNERAQLLVLLSRARRRVTMIPPGRTLRRRRLYTDILDATPEDEATLHTVDLENRLLETVGVPTPHRVPALPVPERERATARALLEGSFDAAPASGRPLLMVHPGSGAEARRWPPAGFARVADHAVRRHAAQVAVLAGPGEESLAEAVVEAMTEGARVIRAPGSLRTLAALLAQVDLFLCNDSGPMHIAAAVGTPVCALYGAESDRTWAPLGAPRAAGHRTLRPDLPCGAACVSPDVCVPGDLMRMHCIRRIPEEDVIAAVDAQLGSGLPHPRPPGGAPRGAAPDA
jgi:ADP-heptose:LPS heptosyltransferase